MHYRYASRMRNMEKSAIREILKAAEREEVISFAGGLPRADLFPSKSLQEACDLVLQEEGKRALQYCTTEGYVPLRQWIAERYKKLYTMDISYKNILITNGSQQGLDLIGKVFLNEGDGVLLEEPSYLGAIQAFQVFQPSYESVKLEEDGISLEQFREALEKKPKLFYCVPEFQNPSGISYSKHKRQQVAKCLNASNTILVEDNPYGELRFEGELQRPINAYMGQNSILLGSFSKIVAPGLRMGWVCASDEIMDALIAVKQGADLHTNHLSQRMIYRYLQREELDGHLSTIKNQYKLQKDYMIDCIEAYLPRGIAYTKPEGGMFLWLTLPEYMDSSMLFDEAIRANIAFVPGETFYVNGGGKQSLRFNFSNCNKSQIEEGMKQLGCLLKKHIKED